MGQKFRKSARLPTWYYGSNAAYFVTICTHKMKHFFGKITNGKMELLILEKLRIPSGMKFPIIFLLLNWANSLQCRIIFMGLSSLIILNKLRNR